MTVIQLKLRTAPNEPRQSGSETLFSFMQKLITQFRFCGRERTAETYTAALNSISRFNGGNTNAACRGYVAN